MTPRHPARSDSPRHGSCGCLAPAPRLPLFPLAAAVLVTLLMAAHAFPGAVRVLFCAPSAWLSAQFLGAALLPSADGFFLDCPRLPVEVTLACSGTTFFALLLMLLIAHDLDRPRGGPHARARRETGRAGTGPLLALAYGTTLAANTARIVLGWYAAVWARAALPPSFHAGVHLAVGLVVFSGFLVSAMLALRLLGPPAGASVFKTASFLILLALTAPRNAAGQADPSTATFAGSYRGALHGIVRDATPAYSEAGFVHFERLVARTVAEDGPEKAGHDEAILQGLMELIGPERPIAGATVTLRSLPGPDSPERVNLKAVTDASGRFSFTSLPGGRYEVAAAIPGHQAAGRPTVQRQIRHEGYERGYLELAYHPRQAIVQGRITDTAGRPLAAVRVTASHHVSNEEGADALYAHTISAVTARDGSYELHGLLPGNIYAGPEPYDIRAEADGAVTAERSVPVMTAETRAASERLWRVLLRNLDTKGETRLAEAKARLPAFQGQAVVGPDFILGKPATVSGRVIDSQQRAQPKCYVYLVPARESPAPMARDAVLPKQVRTDPQGAFVFGGVPAGSYTFRVANDQRGIEAGVPPVTVGEGAVRAGIELTWQVPPLGRIEASVRETGTGNPITDFTASLWNLISTQEVWGARGELRMNASGPGTFAIEGLSPGRAELAIVAPGHVPEHLQVDVAAGQPTTLPVRLERPGTASVHDAQSSTAGPLPCHSSSP